MVAQHFLSPHEEATHEFQQGCDEKGLSPGNPNHRPQHKAAVVPCRAVYRVHVSGCTCMDAPGVLQHFGTRPGTSGSDERDNLKPSR